MHAKDRSIYLADVPRNTIEIWPLKYVKQNWMYKDAKTDMPLVSWSVIEAKGGWLSRTIGFPEGNPPYTFDGYCSPKGAFDFDFESLNLNKVSRESIGKN